MVELNELIKLKIGGLTNSTIDSIIKTLIKTMKLKILVLGEDTQYGKKKKEIKRIDICMYVKKITIIGGYYQ